jgi:signal transduction histidine kinase
LTDVRLERDLAQRQRVSVSEIVGEAEVAASLEAKAGGRALTVLPVAEDIDIEGDPQILSAALGNLLQNAFKFSRAQGHVSVRTTATAARVVIEVEDECGGLPPGKAEEMFLPFSQRGTVRSGLGLGLSISLHGIEAMGGTIGVRDLPGKGCVFAIDLPRLPAE